MTALPDSLRLTFAQVTSASTLDNRVIASHNAPAPQNLNLSAKGLSGGIETKTIAANTTFNSPVPSKETSLA